LSGQTSDPETVRKFFDKLSDTDLKAAISSLGMTFEFLSLLILGYNDVNMFIWDQHAVIGVLRKSHESILIGFTDGRSISGIDSLGTDVDLPYNDFEPYIYLVKRS
jgi:hypothetical protein